MKIKEGEKVILLTRKGKSFLLTLRKGERFHTHLGSIPHEEIIGKEEGAKIVIGRNTPLYIFRPTLWEYIFHMKRISGIIYPKDSSFLILWGDIFPGAKVVEGGVGSGAMLLALARIVGEKGKVISYEEREDMIDIAAFNLREYFGRIPPWVEIKKANIYQGIEEKEVDRIILDVPEPWEVLPHAANSLQGGGILVTYLPTVLQVVRFSQKTREYPFLPPETVELLVRPWYIKGEVARPEHRMVAHTGFLTRVRKISPD